MWFDSDATRTIQIIQELSRHDRIGGAEPLREPIVDWLETGDRVSVAALLAPYTFPTKAI